MISPRQDKTEEDLEYMRIDEALARQALSMLLNMYNDGLDDDDVDVDDDGDDDDDDDV